MENLPLSIKFFSSFKRREYGETISKIPTAATICECAARPNHDLPSNALATVWSMLYKKHDTAKTHQVPGIYFPRHVSVPRRTSITYHLFLWTLFHPQRLLMGRLGSPKLDSTIACTIMFLCDFNANHARRRPKNGVTGDRSGNKYTRESGRAVWTHKQLTSLVWALGHSNQDVLAYTTWTV